MKNAIVLFFTVTYLFTTAQLSELLKLPLMAEHYTEHKKEKPKMTLWDFMCIHYAHGDVNDDDFDKDMRLPFKSHNYCSCTSITFCQPVVNYDFTRKPLFKAGSKKTDFGYHFSFSPGYFSSIWQPPKMC
ncbi:hypothetical protein [Flavobacterium sp. XGLA_31]|uniref:hypothetical protein n=1 Tax=Flavobacterium sp. XGLA_31 TaxID=3447666 RepID=UPI003F3B17BE